MENNLPINYISSGSQKIKHSIMYFTRFAPFWAEFLLRTDFLENNEIMTIGIKIVSFRSIECIYNKNFVESLNFKELNFVLLHEILHLLFRHKFRTKGCNTYLTNIAQDMIINSLIKEYSTKVPLVYLNWAYFIPLDYKDVKIFEKLYEYLLKKIKNILFIKGEKSDLEDKEGRENIEGKLIDIHLEDLTHSEISQIVIEEIISSCKARGYLTKNEAELLKKINESTVNWKQLLKDTIRKTTGKYKLRTYIKRNRRRIIDDMFLPGNKKISNDIVIVIDTSSSIDSFQIEQFFSEIEKIAGIAKIILIQCDTEVKNVYNKGRKQGHIIYKKGDWKKIKIIGRGGTRLMPALDYIKNQKINNKTTILFTDGYCDELNFSKFKKSIIVTTNIKPLLTGNCKPVIIKI